MKHFEHLWEEAENFHKNNHVFSQQEKELWQELKLKIDTVIRVIESSDSNLISKAKFHAFGEILLCLTALSIKANINVFKALETALKLRNI